MDGLQSHRGEFQELLMELYHVVSWFGPPKLTVCVITYSPQDIWQPVDRGIGYFLKRKFWDLLEKELDVVSFVTILRKNIGTHSLLQRRESRLLNWLEKHGAKPAPSRT